MDLTMGLTDFHTKIITNLLRDLLLFFLITSHCSVTYSLTVINPDEGSSNSFDQPSLKGSEDLRTLFDEASSLLKQSVSVLEESKRLNRSPIGQKAKESGKAVYHSEKKNNDGVTDESRRIAASIQESQIHSASTVGVHEDRMKPEIGDRDGFESTVISSYQVSPSLVNESLRILSSPDDDKGFSSKRRVIRTARRMPQSPEKLGPEPYFNDDDDHEEPKRKRRKNKSKRKDKSFPSSSNFFSMGSSNREERGKDKKRPDHQAVAFIVTPGSLMSLLGDQKSKKNGEFRNLEDKLKSFEENAERSRKGSSRIVKMNREKFFSDDGDRFLSNSQSKKSNNRQETFSDDALYKIGYERRRPQKDRKNLKSEFDSTTLPPFLKLLDVPLNSLKSENGGNKFEFSKFLKVLDAIPKAKIDKEKEFGKFSSRDQDLDGPDYRTSKFRKEADERPFFDIKNKYYDSSEFRDDKFDDLDYRRDRGRVSSRTRNNDEYDASGFKRNSDKTKTFRRDEKDLPPLNFASLLDSYNENDKGKDFRRGGRENDDFVGYNSRDESKEDYSKQDDSEEDDNDFQNRYKFLKNDKPPPSSRFSIDKNIDSNKGFKSVIGKNSPFSLLEDLFNVKPGLNRKNRDKTDKGSLANKANSGANQNNNDEKKSLVDILNSFKLNSEVDHNVKGIKQFKIPSRVKPSDENTKDKSADEKTTDITKDLPKNIKLGSLYSTIRPATFKDVTKNIGTGSTSLPALKPTQIPQGFTNSPTTVTTINLKDTNKGILGLNVPPFVRPEGGAPVIINSTFYVTTASPLHFPSAIDFIPRLRTPSFLPSNIQDGVQPGPNGNKFFILNQGPPEHSTDNKIQRKLPTFLPRVNTVSNRGLFGVSNPLQIPPNIGSPPPTTIFPTTKGIPKSAIPGNHPDSRITSIPFSTTFHPTTPNPSLGSPAIPHLTTPFPTNRPTFQFHSSPKVTTPHPTVPFSRNSQLTTPTARKPPPIQRSVTPRPTASLLVTPNPNGHFLATPHPPIQFSASPYPSTLLPGTLRPKVPSNIQHPITPSNLRPHPPKNSGDFVSLPPSNIAVTPFPNIPHGVRFSGPTTLPLVTSESPVHKINQNKSQRLPRKRFRPRGRRVKGKARRGSVPTKAPITLQTTEPAVQITTQQLTTLPPSPPKIVRRLRKKKRKFNGRRKNTASNAAINQSQGRVAVSSHPAARVRQNNIANSLHSNVPKRLRSNKNPVGRKEFENTQIPLLWPNQERQPESFHLNRQPTPESRFSTAGPPLSEHLPVPNEHPFINKVRNIHRVKKPTNSPLTFRERQPSKPPFFIPTPHQKHNSPQITTSLPSHGRISLTGTPLPLLRNHFPGTHPIPSFEDELRIPFRRFPSSATSPRTPISQRTLHSDGHKSTLIVNSVHTTPKDRLSHDKSFLPTTHRVKPPNIPLAVHPFPENISLKSNFPQSQGIFLTSPSPNQSFGPPLARSLKETPTPKVPRLFRGTPTPSVSRLIKGTPTPSVSRLIKGTPTPSVSRLIKGTPTPRVSRLIKGTPSPAHIVGTPTPIIGTPTPTPIIGTPTPTPIIRIPTPTPSVGTPLPRDNNNIPFQGSPRPKIRTSKGQSKQHIPHHRRKLIQDVPVHNILHGILPHHNAYGPVFLDPRSHSLPQSFLSALHPNIRLDLSGQHDLHSGQRNFHGLSTQPFASSLRHHPAVISPHLRSGTPSQYYAQSSFGGIPINGLSPLHAGSPPLRKYYVRKTFAGHSHERSR